MSSPTPAHPVLAHIHVPKCAGTSVRHLLDQVWTGRHLSLYVSGPTTFVYEDRELDRLLQPDDVKAFSSHFVRRFPPTVSGRPMYYVTFLREPAEQWISYLTYTRKVYLQIPDPVLLQQLPPNMPHLSLRECAQWLLSHDERTFVNFRENYLVNFFARYEAASRFGLDYADSKYRRIRLHVAQQTLRRFYFVGMTDRLEESFALLRRRLKGTTLELPVVRIPVENLSHEQRDDLTWLSPEDLIGRQVLLSLREDMRLYHWARKRFEHHLAAECEGQAALR